MCPWYVRRSVFKDGHKICNYMETRLTRRWPFTLLVKNTAQDSLPCRSWAQIFVQASPICLPWFPGQVCRKSRAVLRLGVQGSVTLSASLASDDTQKRNGLTIVHARQMRTSPWCLWSLPLALAPQPHLLKTSNRIEHPFLV